MCVYVFCFEQLKIENPTPKNLELPQELLYKHVSEIKTFSWESKETTREKHHIPVTDFKYN